MYMYNIIIMYICIYYNNNIICLYVYMYNIIMCVAMCICLIICNMCISNILCNNNIVYNIIFICNNIIMWRAGVKLGGVTTSLLRYRHLHLALSLLNSHLLCHLSLLYSPIRCHHRLSPNKLEFWQRSCSIRWHWRGLLAAYHHSPSAGRRPPRVRLLLLRAEHSVWCAALYGS